jgi:acyl carrier protein
MEPNYFDLVVNEVAATMEIPAGSLSPSTTFAEIGMDSLQALQLLVALEQLTHMKFEEPDLKHFITVQSTVDLLIERSKGATA